MGVKCCQHHLGPKVCSNPRVELKPAFLLDWGISFFRCLIIHYESWPRNVFQWPSEETRNMLQIAVFYMLHDQAKSPVEVIKPYHICNWIMNWRERSYPDPVDWFKSSTTFWRVFFPASFLVHKTFYLNGKYQIGILISCWNFISNSNTFRHESTQWMRRTNTRR